jgi:hypothetical protein
LLIVGAPFGEWRDKPQADRTMIHFKKHFKKWEKDRRLMLTTSAAGYHGANRVREAPPAPAVDAPLTEMVAGYKASRT